MNSINNPDILKRACDYITHAFSPQGTTWSKVASIALIAFSIITVVPFAYWGIRKIVIHQFEIPALQKKVDDVFKHVRPLLKDEAAEATDKTMKLLISAILEAQRACKTDVFENIYLGLIDAMKQLQSAIDSATATQKEVLDKINTEKASAQQNIQQLEAYQNQVNALRTQLGDLDSGAIPNDLQKELTAISNRINELKALESSSSSSSSESQDNLTRTISDAKGMLHSTLKFYISGMDSMARDLTQMMQEIGTARYEAYEAEELSGIPSKIQRLEQIGEDLNTATNMYTSLSTAYDALNNLDKYPDAKTAIQGFNFTDIGDSLNAVTDAYTHQLYLAKEQEKAAQAASSSPQSQVEPQHVTLPQPPVAVPQDTLAGDKIPRADEVEIMPRSYYTFDIKDQIRNHEIAKAFLLRELNVLGAKASFVSPQGPLNIDLTKLDLSNPPLDANVFGYEASTGVLQEIQQDSKDPKKIVLYSVASQDNAIEASDRFVHNPQDTQSTINAYESDRTQGPQAQLAFPREQIMTLVRGANIGFSILGHVLDEQTKTARRFGYITPTSTEQANLLIKQLRKDGNKAEFLCIGNVPVNGTSPVYSMYVAAPAFGQYRNVERLNNTTTQEQEFEIAFLCALNSFRAQMQQALTLARDEANKGKPVVLRPVAVGVGVFGNNPQATASAFYVAGKQYEEELRAANVQVRLQIYHTDFGFNGTAMAIADSLKLKQKERL